MWALSFCNGCSFHHSLAQVFCIKLNAQFSLQEVICEPGLQIAPSEWSHFAPKILVSPKKSFPSACACATSKFATFLIL